jgi:hypothetical protein
MARSTRLFLLPALLFVCVTTARSQTTDTTQLFAAARTAELFAEEAIRKFAIFRPEGPPYNLQECDEQIGNWCIYYEPAGRSLPDEPSKVVKARQEAIVALRKAYDVAPGRTATVYPLVRLLVKDGRADEAVDVAKGYLAQRDSADAHMVMGYALHHARRTEEALPEFYKWLASAPVYVRDKAQDIAWLLQPKLVPKYRMHTDKLWRYADALYMTPGNETLTEHYARHAFAAMMAVRPIPSNREPWTAHEEQMLVRFGPDVVVTRRFAQTGSASVSQSFLGHWDNTAHTYFPPDFDRVIEMRAPVDTLWPTDTLVGRSGHAPPTIRFMRSLQHQASVFPGNVLMVAGGTKTDKLSAGKTMQGALYLLDASFNVVGRSDATVRTMGDSLVFVGQMPVGDNARFFSAEVYDPETRFAARARYRLEFPASSGGMTLSGIMITRPYEAGQLPTSRGDESAKPLTRPVVKPGQALGIYSELTIPGDARKSVNVELEVRSIDKPSTVTRLAGWVGSRLGFVGNTDTPGRLGWSLEVDPGKPNAVALTVDPGRLSGGRYLVTLKVTDPVSMAVVVAEREFLTR